MNINCMICSDLFLPNAEIFAIHCGHVFHHHCLLQWFERSKSCPSCRVRTSTKNIYRLYFTFLSDDGIEEDVATLQNKVDSLNLALRLKENFLKTTEEEIERVKAENQTIEHDLKSLKVDYDKSKAGNDNLRQQIMMFREQVKSMDQTQKENKKLREKLRAHKIETTTLNGTYEEAQSVINNCDSIQTLSMISTSLKKELISMERKRNHVLSKLRQTENELYSVKKDAEQFKKEIDDLECELNGHKQCEAQILQLRKEITKLMEGKTEPINPNLIRIVTESPAPMLTKMKPNNESFEMNESPSISMRVQDIKESESPYLTVKSNCMNMFLKSDNSRIKLSQSISIFKKNAPSTSVSNAAIPEGSYNGFGGHAKEDRYPTPKLTGLKRSKSSTLHSKKFRPLDKKNKKLEDFFHP